MTERHRGSMNLDPQLYLRLREKSEKPLRFAAERFAAYGFKQVFNVEGGMDAWMREIGA